MRNRVHGHRVQTATELSGALFEEYAVICGDFIFFCCILRDFTDMHEQTRAYIHTPHTQKDDHAYGQIIFHAHTDSLTLHSTLPALKSFDFAVFSDTTYLDYPVL